MPWAKYLHFYIEPNFNPTNILKGNVDSGNAWISTTRLVKIEVASMQSFLIWNHIYHSCQPLLLLIYFIVQLQNLLISLIQQRGLSIWKLDYSSDFGNATWYGALASLPAIFLLFYPDLWQASCWSYQAEFSATKIKVNLFFHGLAFNRKFCNWRL